MSHLVVRAVDVGYGHIKFTTGRDAETGLIQTDSFPSKSPAIGPVAATSKVLSHRDTALVPIGQTIYEVGKEVDFALSVDDASEVLDSNYPMTGAYAARLFGALNYMYAGLPSHTIDYLVLGLPLSTIRQHAATLAERFRGAHVINTQKQEITVRHVEVFPQPLGSYMAYLAATPTAPGKKVPMALVVDPGFNTVDWYVIRGTTPADVKSGAVNRGMGAILKAMAEAMVSPVAQGGCEEVQGGTWQEVARRIDFAMSRGEPFSMAGRTIDLSPWRAVGAPIIEDAAQAVKNSIGLGGEIDVIIVTGGGAAAYADAIRAKFPRHRVEILPDPAFANARGFHYLGERLARSAERATASAAIA